MDTRVVQGFGFSWEEKLWTWGSMNTASMPNSLTQLHPFPELRGCCREDMDALTNYRKLHSQLYAFQRISSQVNKKHCIAPADTFSKPSCLSLQATFILFCVWVQRRKYFCFSPFWIVQWQETIKHRIYLEIQRNPKQRC